MANKSSILSYIKSTKKPKVNPHVAKLQSALKGEKGNKGDPGSPGPRGPKGERGEKGEPGEKPIKGIDYWVMHGKDGRDGRDGRDGIDAISGGDSLLENSTFTYVGSLVTRIDYESGQSKVFTYNADNTINTIVWTRILDVVTKSFVYNANGELVSITVVIV